MLHCMKPVIVIAMLVLSAAVLAQPSAESAWLAFQQARGEPSLINAGADHPLAETAFRPIPMFRADDIDQDRLRLGFDLFHERALSRDNTIGCNTCHSGMAGGGDGRAVAMGIGGALGLLNSPTTFNSALNFRQFWDGRAFDLKEQALGPIESPIEMGHDLDEVVAMLNNNTAYRTQFETIYPDGVTRHNIGDALAYFQTINFTRGNSPFTRHLDDQPGQLSTQAQRGLERFQAVGCSSCHNGINLGGNSYQQLGAVIPFFGTERTAGPADDGVYARTGREFDKHVFKVPTLHNIAATRPWFHDGSISTLESAVEEMAEHQLGRQLSDDDVADIVAFLESLGGGMMGGMMGGSMGQGQGMRMGQGQGMSQGQGMRMGQGRGGMGGGMGRGMGRGADAGLAQDINGAEPTINRDMLPDDFQSQHHTDYQQALQVVTEARARLDHEMARIINGSVAHYDFLQYEHIEMIRHARALAHPPTDIEPGLRADMIRQGEELLAAAESLEWVIADFLRAQALVQIASLNITDLTSILAGSASSAQQQQFRDIQQAAQTYREQPGEATGQSLQQAVVRLDTNDLDAQHLEELEHHISLLIANAAIPEAQRRMLQ